MLERRRIGRLEVSLAGLGCNNLGWLTDAAVSTEIVQAAFEAGVRHFDTADVYGGGRSEEFLGNALGPRRSDVTITTKFGGEAPSDGTAPGSAGWVHKACEASLRRLRTDYIDVYLLHYPDPLTPIQETLGALADLQKAGKVRELGCSNFTAEDLAAAARAAREVDVTGFSCVEASYSLLDRTPETSLLPACGELDIMLLPYFPLASGLLTGKYGRNVWPEGTRLGSDYFQQRYPQLRTDDCIAIVERLRAFAEARGQTLLTLALSWLAANRSVASVIAGATSVEQARSNAEAVTGWNLTPTELAEVGRLTSLETAFTAPTGSTPAADGTE